MTKEMKHVDSIEMANANADTGSRKRCRAAAAALDSDCNDGMLGMMKLAIDAESKSNCAICLEPLSKNDLSILETCPHVYHSECLEVWLKRARSCPVCREEAGALYKRAEGADVVTREEIARPDKRQTLSELMGDDDARNTTLDDFLLSVSALASTIYEEESAEDDTEGDDDYDDEDDEDNNDDNSDAVDSGAAVEPYTPITRMLVARRPGYGYSFAGTPARQERELGFLIVSLPGFPVRLPSRVWPRN